MSTRGLSFADHWHKWPERGKESVTLDSDCSRYDAVRSGRERMTLWWFFSDPCSRSPLVCWDSFAHANQEQGGVTCREPNSFPGIDSIELSAAFFEPSSDGTAGKILEGWEDMGGPIFGVRDFATGVAGEGNSYMDYIDYITI